MNKFLELLFLKQLKGIGNVAINKKYAPLLKDKDGIDECVKLVEDTETKLSSLDIQMARETAEKKYREIFDTFEIEVITIFDDKYPNRLNDMGDKKPVILYAKGDADILNNKSIAVVGTRKPSSWSEKVEERLVQKILDISDFVIVSGLALGCDKIAHQTTLDSKAKTIAVLPSGVNVITPASHKKMAQDIIDNGGCLISEYEPKAKVTKSTYVERDAVVAALTNATMVIECGVKSGTMHTVDYAFDMKRALACYYIEDATKGQYDGNAYMIKIKKAAKVSDTNELEVFLKGLSNQEKTVEPEQLSIFDTMKNE